MDPAVSHKQSVLEPRAHLAVTPAPEPIGIGLSAAILAVSADEPVVAVVVPADSVGDGVRSQRGIQSGNDVRKNDQRVAVVVLRAPVAARLPCPTSCALWKRSPPRMDRLQRRSAIRSARRRSESRCGAV